MAHFIFDYKM